MKAGSDALYGPLEPGEVLGFTLVGPLAGGPCTPNQGPMEVIHVAGAWDEPNPLTLTVDVVLKGTRYTVTVNLATNEAVVRMAHNNEVMGSSKFGRRKRALVEANRILSRVIETLPLFANEEED